MTRSSLNAAAIRDGMLTRWRDPEWAIMWEVGQGTGAQSGRYADAVMMSLWPSRGLELHGVEIKVSRSDWRREAADPGKAEAVARYCDRWWIHTPPGVVPDLSEMPPAWGLREWDGRNWSTRREAEKTEAEPVSRVFLASMLRRADGALRAMERAAEQRGQASVEVARQRLEEAYAKKIDDEVKRRTSDLERIAANRAAFDAAFGKDVLVHWGVDHASLGRAARTLHDMRPNGYGSFAQRLRAAADEIDALQALVMTEDRA